MGNLRLLMTIAILDLSAAMVPGPNALFIANAAAHSTRRPALAAAAGVVLGSAIWASTALMGLATILKAAPTLFRFMEIAGGIYLIILGIQSLRAALPRSIMLGTDPATPPRLLFRQGAQISISNPQVILFFGTLFTGSFQQGTSTFVRVLALPTVTLVDLAWYGSLALLFTFPTMQLTFSRYGRSIGALFSLVLVFYGGKAVWTGVTHIS